MKNLIKLSSIICLVIMLSSCTRYITFNALSPAEITLPNEVKSIALVNRAVPTNNKTNILEGVLTGELPGQDKQGRQQVLMGLADQLRNTPAFSTLMSQEELNGSATGGQFPKALSKSEIESLCKKYQVDAIVVMEVYDSDCIPSAAELKESKTTNKDGSVTVKKFFQVVQVGNIVAGFRIYDKTGKIVDEYEVKRNFSWITTGDNALEAVASISARVDYMNNMSNQIGADFSSHIAPYWIRVTREFYKKGKNPLLKIGRRYIDTNNWTEAEKAFNSVIQQTGGVGKDAAKAYHNLAVCYEVNGELEKAHEFASKAYVIKGKSLSQQYAQILQNRINTEKIVQQQIHK